jgi:energy-coupling factor transport system ATP-binding protein
MTTNEYARDYPVVLENVSFSYRGSNTVLRDVNLKIRRGEFFGIVGPTGAGKTTLLYAISGVVPHYYSGLLSGRVVTCGLDTSRHTLNEISRKANLVMQDPESQLFNLHVTEELRWGLENLGVSNNEIDERTNQVAKFMRIDNFKDRLTFNLSGGEKQKVAIASVYVLEPEVILLDEPTSELDSQGSDLVFEVIRKLTSRKGTTVIMVEHKVEQLAEFADRIALMNDGKILTISEPREFFVNDALHEVGIDPPQIIELGHRLKSRFPVSRIPLTLAEAVQAYGGFPRSYNGLDNYAHGKRAKVRDSSSKPIIEVVDLELTYPPPHEHTALKDINLTIDRGEFTALIGHNGSGKTTLARCIVGLLKPTRGRVYVNGVDNRNIPLSRMAQTVGFVFQNPNHQIFNDTVWSEITCGLKNLKKPRDYIKQRGEEVLKLMDLERYRDIHPFRLGEGTKQRVAVASILAMNPELLIVDEPTTGHSPRESMMVCQLLQSLNKEGMTILMVTHSMPLVAQYATRVIVLADGKIVDDGPPRHIFNNTKVLDIAGMHPPQISRLGLLLDLRPPPLTVDEMEKAFL